MKKGDKVRAKETEYANDMEWTGMEGVIVGPSLADAFEWTVLFECVNGQYKEDLFNEDELELVEEQP